MTRTITEIIISAAPQASRRVPPRSDVHGCRVVNPRQAAIVYNIAPPPHHDEREEERARDAQEQGAERQAAAPRGRAERHSAAAAADAQGALAAQHTDRRRARLQVVARRAALARRRGRGADDGDTAELVDVQSRRLAREPRAPTAVRADRRARVGDDDAHAALHAARPRARAPQADTRRAHAQGCDDTRIERRATNQSHRAAVLRYKGIRRRDRAPQAFNAPRPARCRAPPPSSHCSTATAAARPAARCQGRSR